MAFIWTVPAEKPDPASIERMRQYFHKPRDFMPEAWFMGEMVYFSKLERDSDTKYILHVLENIESGTRIFPGADGGTWSEWFHYLLPDLILRTNQPQSYYETEMLIATFLAFFTLYPDGIQERYVGFRDDIVSALGLRVFPTQIARERMDSPAAASRLFVDIWDNSGAIEGWGFTLLDEVWQPLLFCIQYLNPEEIVPWALSLFQIPNPQWSQQLIFLLPEWLSQSSPEHFASPNGRIFTQVVHEQLTPEVFTDWESTLLAEINREPYNIANYFYLTPILEEHLKQAKASLFGM